MGTLLRYAKATPISLREHADFDEKWLQTRIADDPGILGLGEVDLLSRERTQERAGRLDLLLYDQNENVRYEVELMLGATDESHIIRAIEYWDIERRRYPGYDHCAVLVAEDITSRFLNVLSLFAGTIPFIAIQLNALQVGDQIILDFVRVLDRVSLRRDDESEETTSLADRAYWVARTSQQTVEAIDQLIQLVNEKASRKFHPNYVRSYVGMNDGARARNFVYFTPKKQFLYLNVEVAQRAEWVQKLEEAGLEAGQGNRFVWVTLRPAELARHLPLLREVVHRAVEEFESEG